MHFDGLGWLHGIEYILFLLFMCHDHGCAWMWVCWLCCQMHMRSIALYLKYLPWWIKIIPLGANSCILTSILLLIHCFLFIINYFDNYDSSTQSFPSLPWTAFCLPGHVNHKGLSHVAGSQTCTHVNYTLQIPPVHGLRHLVAVSPGLPATLFTTDAYKSTWHSAT